MWKFLFLFFISVNFTFSSPSKRSSDRDVAPCLKKFYEAIYDGTCNCTGSYDFLSNNSTILQKAFVGGKSCFLEVIKSECTSIQYDEIESEYDYLIEILTTTPSEEDCENPYYQFHAQKCVAILDYVSVNNKELYPMETKINDSRVLSLISKCEEAEECIKPVCISTETLRSVISGACEKLRMKNSEFTACQFKLDRTPLNETLFSCLEGFDFFGNTLETEIKKFSNKKECTKEIMEKTCGKKSVEKFDYYANQMLQVLENARDEENEEH